MTTYIYIDVTGFAADFTGRIQCDFSGVGQGWRTVKPADLPPEVLGAIADASGEISDGDSAVVGGLRYRAIAAE